MTLSLTLLAGLSGACTREPGPDEPASAAVFAEDIPCPSCALTVDRTIRGMLKSHEHYAASHFPIRWMKALYVLEGVAQGTEPIDIGDGTHGELIDHVVGTVEFDAIFLNWEDAEHITETTADSLPFEQ